MPLIEARSLSKIYMLGKTEVHALNAVNLTVEKGEFMAIAGPSGSGKTTLLNILGCIEKPTEGSVLFDGKNVAQLSGNQLADFRLNHIGFIFQTFNLIPVLTAIENVEFPLLKMPLSKRERRTRAQEALESVGLGGLAHRKPDELSGGQRQRVAIARALVGRPNIVLADEPTANLDHATGLAVLELMSDLNSRLGTVFVFSTHDPKVMSMARRVISLVDGKIVEETTVP
ncbi:putative ABC transport system ATP-binding protein [Desulfacinum infernum DSM 9756]|uniref:Putative ABC transport system ATP-binding protein n=1 Tax=Desulfacinum infernum DSM 9756 TaxID=1121391 RepID=A0A1M5IDH9_9BACT|nr:ABC transporter ATP-binding protein [Desulfacinum infernum]SHG26295.1 putative ABC transport system ATP-binding protein [Desulfacinum infernum DSM 9756]